MKRICEIISNNYYFNNNIRRLNTQNKEVILGLIYLIGIVIILEQKI